MMNRLKMTALAIPVVMAPILISQGKDIVRPLPDPPTLEQQVRNSELVVHARLVHVHRYNLSRKLVSQPRFEIVRILKDSRFYPLNQGERITVTHYLKPNEYGPYFQEPPEKGEYIVFLKVRNVDLGGKIVGYISEFPLPHPFALQEMEKGLVEKVEQLVLQDKSRKLKRTAGAR